MDFEKTVCGFIRRENLILPGEKVLAGISGGADSTALLIFLDEFGKELGISLEAVHVEHGIRGGESLSDEAFVRDLCSRRGIKLHVEHADVPALASYKGESLEEAARNARLEIFEKIRQKTGADKIALAHHADDQAETVLLNLFRGTGLKGLAGMRSARDRIVRPFLCVARAMIEQWLTDKGQPWRTDSTNLETDQIRNRIRINLLPMINAQVNTAASRHICEAAAIAGEAVDHLEREIDSLESSVTDYFPDESKAVVSCRDLSGLDPVLASGLIRRMIRRINDGDGLKDLTRTHIGNILALAEKGGGKKTDLPGTLEAVRIRDEVVLRKTGPAGEKEDDFSGEELVITESGCFAYASRIFRVSFPDEETMRDLLAAGIPEKKYTKWLACDKMKNTVCLRTRRTGDYLTVNAGGGRKSLKDYLIDEKVPAGERDRVIVAAQGSHVLWVVGHRISYGARVTDETEKTVCISIDGEET